MTVDVPAGPRERTELVVAPVTITPTKPLTPTHVKGLLWTDLVLKASARLTPVRLVWNNRAATVTAQSTAFWRHLDLTEPDTDWSTETALAIGERYVRYHAGRPRTDPRPLNDYLSAADRGWIHPAGRRMLDLWHAELDLLGAAHPGLALDRPLGITACDALGVLADRGLLLDHRPYGGPAHLDGTRWGLPLRQLVGADGHPNYLLPILRELIPMIRPDRTFLLIHDDDLTADYVLLHRVLTECGSRVARLPLSRVPIAGSTRSSRYGGWRGATLGELSATAGTADRAAYRLGMRLYFTGILQRGSAQPFRLPLLRRCVGRAARLLDDAADRAAAPADHTLDAALGRLRTGPGHVDPYRLTTALLGGRLLPSAPQLRALYT
ncbi:hypothetical protein ABZ307_06250 [Streptomyces griseorubiginosus]|uniref:hypothetical protein n=1 Tax=Streptomyces griseorubiginosus TaxID=67304 RepID=UPI0033A10590